MSKDQIIMVTLAGKNIELPFNLLDGFITYFGIFFLQIQMD